MINIRFPYETQLEIMRITAGVFYFLGMAAFIFLPVIEIFMTTLMLLIIFVNYDQRLRSFREHKAIHEYQQTILKTLKKHIKKGRV